MSLIVDIEKQLGSFSLKMKFEIGTEVLALLGASGSGKSMTLKCIAGIEKPDRGYIELDGRVLYDSEKGVCLTPQKRHIGYLFQQYALFPNMTVRQNILCGIRRPEFAEKHKSERKQSVLDAETRVSEMIRTMHLEGLEDKFPSQISGGEQQRTALARILVNDPEVLLLDEPFSALDTHLRFRLEQELRELLRQFHKPVLLVSHDRDEAYRLADRIAVIRAGAMETIGAKQEVFADPRTVDAARLTGCKNISRIRQEGADARHFFAEDWGITLRTDRDLNGYQFVGIRMHDIQIPDTEETKANSFACRIVEVIENPFSFTVMVQPVKGADSGAGGVPVGIELDKKTWLESKKEYVKVYFPPEKLLLLRSGEPTK